MIRGTVFLVLAGCAAEIPSGSYLCGPDDACPDGQVCDAPTQRCVAPGLETKFLCDPTEQHDDATPATATSLGTVGYSASPRTAQGCLDVTDGEDWFSVTSTTDCDPLALHVALTYPGMYAALTLVVADHLGNTLANDQGEPDATPGDVTLKADIGVHVGETWTIQLKPLVHDNCFNCTDNRYSLSVAFTPN